MSSNLTIESPDFDYIKKESGVITSDAIKLIWLALNFEIQNRRSTVNAATDRLEGKITSDSSTLSEDNLDVQGSLIWWYNTSSAINVTGIRNGIEGRVVFIHNVGSGTITFKHNTTSDASNRLLLAAAADKAVATNKSIVLMFINSRWREMSLA